MAQTPNDARTLNLTPPGYRHSENVPAGKTCEPLFAARPPLAIAIHPAPGATGTIEYSLSPRSLIEAGQGKWMSWPKGGVTADAEDIRLAPVTALRCKAVGGDVLWEVAGEVPT